MRTAQANLARFKRPHSIKFVDALPRNATGKIHKPTLRKTFGSPMPSIRPRPSFRSLIEALNVVPPERAN